MDKDKGDGYIGMRTDDPWEGEGRRHKVRRLAEWLFMVQFKEGLRTNTTLFPDAIAREAIATAEVFDREFENHQAEARATAKHEEMKQKHDLGREQW